MPAIEPTSLWAATWTPPVAEAVDAALEVPTDADVVIVGAGYTGLWTALSLTEAEPTMRVVVLERRHVGFGASGRNGGWCSALLPVGLDALTRRHGRDAAIALQRAMFDTVAAVGRFAGSAEAADGGGDGLFHRGGTVTLARTDRQLAAVREEVAIARRYGIGDDALRLLDAAAAADVCAATEVRGAVFSPHCAAIHPLRLATSLAAACRRRGVAIVEGVSVVGIEERDGPDAGVVTDRGRVSAPVVVLATEAFTTQLPGRRRDSLPVYSMMIGSEPLPDEQWAAIGLADRPTFADARHTVIYGQRTADGRLAFGGRGAPYHFGSRIEPVFDTDQAVRRQLRDTVVELFPSLVDVEFPFHWGGPLAVPRDWHPHVRFDRTTGIASAGGYVGDGVATANLAGRALADVIVGRDTELTRLPIVGHRSRRWEPEPLRWAGVRMAALAAHRADDADAAGRPRSAAAWGRVLTTLSG